MDINKCLQPRSDGVFSSARRMLTNTFNSVGNLTEATEYSSRVITLQAKRYELASELELLSQFKELTKSKKSKK